MKRSPLVRKTGLKRGGPIARKSCVRRVRLKRFEQLKQYWKRVPEFLKEHPVCQVWLSENGFTEMDLTRTRTGEWAVRKMIPDLRAEIAPGAAPMVSHFEYYTDVILSDQVHHRNKRRGARLLEESEWMAVSRFYHEKIEKDKAWARAKGYLRNF